MQITHDIPAARIHDLPVSVTVGNFDGVHRGHRTLLDRVVASAREAGGEAVVVTFDPHPLCVLRPDSCPEAITTLDEKCAVLGDVGVDRVVVQTFDDAVAHWSAAEFMNRLGGAFAIRDMVVGHDFALGHRRQGDHAFLVEYGAVHGFAVDRVAAAGGATPWSSSGIRAALRGGDVVTAATALGRDYFIDASVVHGEKLGRTLGFPTANLAITPGKCLPQRGVYCGHFRVDGEWHMAATNIGFRPTFGGDRLTVEAFVLDYDGDIYDRDIRLTFVERLREERTYPDAASLVAQMHDDVAAARNILAGHQPGG